MNLLKAFADYVKSDFELEGYLGERVYRDRALPETTTPLLVYARESASVGVGVFQNVNGAKESVLVVEVVGKYEEQDTLDTIRDMLVEKLGGLNGALTVDWSGVVEVKGTEDRYDAQTERAVRRLELRCREAY